VPAPLPEDVAVAAELASLDFTRWDAVFYAFGADKPSFQTLQIESEAFSREEPSVDFVLSFLAFVLVDASPPPELLERIPSLATRGDTYVHDFVAVTGAVGLVFQTMMGRLLDRAAQVVGEVTQDTWRTLLRAAKTEVTGFVALMVAMILHRMPALTRLRLDGAPAKVLVYRAVEDSLSELFEVALPLFYRHFYAREDEAAYGACVAAVAAPQAGVGAMAMDLLKRALDFDRPSPMTRLRFAIAGVRLFAGPAGAPVGGDELLPMLVAALQRMQPVRLVSRVMLLKDMLPSDLVAGEDAFAVALLESAVSALGVDVASA